MRRVFDDGPAGARPGAALLPLVVKLKSRLRGHAGRRHHREHARQHRRGSATAALLRALRRRFGLLGGAGARTTMPQAIDTSPGTTNAARQPNHLTRKPVTQRGDRDAEVAGEPVDADGRARARGVLHQHRNADRVIDRRRTRRSASARARAATAAASAPPAAPTRRCRRRRRASSGAGPTGRRAGRPAASRGRTSRTRRRCTASGLPSARSRTRPRSRVTAVAKISRNM